MSNAEESIEPAGNLNVSKGFSAPAVMRTKSLIGKTLFSRTFPRDSVWTIGVWMWGLLLSYINIRPLWENDFYLHLRMGNDILAHHRLTGDPSWVYGTAHVSWKTTMAVSEVLMALAYRYGGYPIFAVSLMFASILILVILWKTIRLLIPQKVSPIAFRLIFISAVFLSTWMNTFFLARPQTISLLLMPILALWSIRFALYGKLPRIILLVPFTIFWVCMHGYGLLILPLLLASGVAHMAGSLFASKGLRLKFLSLSWNRVKRNIPAFFAIALATLVNPLGFGIYTTSLKVRAASNTFISEWVAPSVTSFSYIMFLVVSALWVMLSAVFLYKKGSPSNNKVAVAREGFLILFITFALASSLRTLEIVILYISLILINRLTRTFTNETTTRHWETLRSAKSSEYLKIGIIVLVTLTWVSALLTTHSIYSMGKNEIPVKIFKEINSVSGHHKILIDYNISSTPLIYVQDASTALDGRTDENGPHGSRDYAMMSKGLLKDWKTVFNRYPGTTDAVFQSKDKIVSLLIGEGWKVKDTEKIPGEKAPYEWLTPPVK